MEKQVRKQFNENFSVGVYEDFLKDLDSKHPGHLVFRVAETPVFVPKYFTQKMIDACEAIIDIIVAPDFKPLTDRAIPPHEFVPNENDHTHFIAFDFGVCENDSGGLEPQLIEMQGFPTLFAFQAYYPDIIRKHFNIPPNYNEFLNGFTKDSYIQLLKEIVVGDHDPENVILLEINPTEQKTRIDFYCTEDYLGIKMVNLTDLIQDGKDVFYMHDGKKTQVKRIYNRVIFDELSQKKDSLGDIVDITKPLNVEWVPHPNWFYRISKFTLPYIKHPYVPETTFLSDVKEVPSDLENYVLKPLFSFAGQGVVIDVTPSDIQKTTDRENWILQRKVRYANVIETPDVPAKAEIRIFYFWKDGDPRPVAVTNLARLSKGKMIGVRYNADKEWVGGSVALFEK
jgi:hypothetical protein